MDKEKLGQEYVETEFFKDNEKYKDDITVCVNGKVWRIKRGITVRIPKNVYDVVRESHSQDVRTAMMCEQFENEFKEEDKKYNN